MTVLVLGSYIERKNVRTLVPAYFRTVRTSWRSYVPTGFFLLPDKHDKLPSASIRLWEAYSESPLDHLHRLIVWIFAH